MTSTSDRQFVILEHDTDPHHFDVMLEADDTLWTWACYRTTFPNDVDQLSIEQLPNHRKDYLTYEGPISNDRGTVTRVEEGTWTPTSPPQPNKQIQGTFDGTTWSFPFTLTKTDETGRRNNPLWLLENTTYDKK